MSQISCKTFATQCFLFATQSFSTDYLNQKTLNKAVSGQLPRENLPPQLRLGLGLGLGLE